jgi:hypothetical protein
MNQEEATHSRTRKRKVIWTVSLVCLVGCWAFICAFVYWIIPPPTDWDPPQETNRVWHPTGMSIILPDGWEADMLPNSLNAHPVHGQGLPPRSDPGLTIVRYSEDPKWPFFEWRQSTFQGQPCRRIVRTNISFHCFSTVSIEFSRGSNWFGLYSANLFPEDVEGYFRSFRYDPNHRFESDPNKQR